MSAGLKDVQLSQAGETVMDSPFKDVAPTSKPSNLTSGRVILKLVDKNKNGRVWIDGCYEMVNPKTGLTDMMRLLRGVGKIWMSEQEKLPKETIDHNRRSLLFENGISTLKPNDVSGIEFARNIIAYGKGGKHAFYEWNPIAQEREALEREMLENEVVKIAMTEPYEKVRKHAAFMNISFYDEMGEPRTENGVRTLYIREAKRRPEFFKKTFGSKEVEVSYLVKRAIIDAKIDTGGITGTISWANGGGFIAKIPKGREPKEYLIELAMLPTDEGKQFLDTLQSTVK